MSSLCSGSRVFFLFVIFCIIKGYMVYTLNSVPLFKGTLLNAGNGSNLFSRNNSFEKYYEPYYHSLMGRGTKVLQLSNGTFTLIENAMDSLHSSIKNDTDDNSDCPTCMFKCHPVHCTVYVETIVVIDSTMWTEFKNSTKVVIQYLAKYWTIVDLRFRNIKNPRIRLSIVGVIISTTPEDDKRYLNKVKNSTIKIHKKTYYYPKKLFKRTNVDALAVITRKMITSDGLKGIASSKPVCNRRGGIIFVHDTGMFSGVFATVQYFARILGVDQFENDRRGYLMDNDQDGNVNFENVNNNRWFFSKEHSKKLRHFTRHATCLCNYPDIGVPIRKQALLTLGFSLEEQCQHEHSDGKPLNFIKDPNEVCELLTCGLDNVILKRYKPPLEGTDCTNNKVCINGKCMLKPREIYNWD